MKAKKSMRRESWQDVANSSSLRLPPFVAAALFMELSGEKLRPKLYWALADGPYQAGHSRKPKEIRMGPPLQNSCREAAAEKLDFL